LSEREYINLVRSVCMFRGTANAHLIPQYMERIKQLEKELGPNTPTNIRENGLHRVTYFVNGECKELV